MLSFIITIVKLLLILCIVATVHEFGHFLMAKLCKTRVNEFSIGFGPKIIQKKYGDTMYSLRCIPLGGYCAIEGEDGESTAEDSFVSKTPLQKILILVMGVTFNAILAAIVFFGIAFSSNTYTTRVANVDSNSVLAQSGIESGDKIISINGKKVKILADIANMEVPDTKDVEVVYERNSEIHSTIVENAVYEIGYIGVSFKSDGEAVTNQIEMVSSGSSAADSKLKAGDIIENIEGKEVKNAAEAIEIIKHNPGIELSFELIRDGNKFEEKVVPKSKTVLDLGITDAEYAKTTFPLAIASASNNITAIVRSYVNLFKGKVQVKEMSGIVGIGEVVSNTSSFTEFLNLLGIISLAIGIANIMPFPPLDGGKVVIVIGETITRKKLPPKAEMIISYIGFGLLILLTLVVTYNDIVRII